MGPKLYAAVRLYIDGVRDGHLDVALDKYVSADMIQRTCGIGPGRAGLAEHFGAMISGHERRMVRPMRGFEDGSTVFLHTFHSYGLRAHEHVSIDIFDTDADDHIVEHWNVSTPLRTGSRSGCSQIDGPTYVTDPDATEANKALVRTYVDEVLSGGRTDRIDRYVSVESFVQHDPDIGTGIRGYLSHLSETAAAGTPVRYARSEALVGSGNFVAIAGHCATGASAQIVSDLFRLEFGRIVEHWDVIAPAIS